MTDLADLDLGAEPGPPNLGAPPPKPCRRHRWFEHHAGGISMFGCERCPVILTEEQYRIRTRRGRNARSRGNRRELELARALNGEKVGMYGGPVDVQTPLINAQSKVRRGAAFPGWMTDELAKLPRTGGRIPALIVTDSPGPGITRRCLVVLDFDDFTELHGRIPETSE